MFKVNYKNTRPTLMTADKVTILLKEEEITKRDDTGGLGCLIDNK